MSDLAGILEDGVGAAALRSLPGDWPPPDSQLDLLRDPVASLYGIRTTKGLTRDQVDRRLAAIADALAGSRPAMLAVLFSPGALVSTIPLLAGPDPVDQVDQWLGTCWVAEACWRALHGKLTDRGFAAGDSDLLLPLAARLRFLALIEPMRHRGQAGHPLVPAGQPSDSADARTLSRVFGPDSRNDLVGRCREARREWMSYLDAYQSHPFISRATSAEFDHELQSLLFRDGRRSGLLVISDAPLPSDAPLTAEDATVVGELTERHLLPRFDVLSVTALAGYDKDRKGRAWRKAGAAVAALLGLAAVICALWLKIHVAVGLALACYALIGAGAIRFGPAWTAPWLLRLPAAAAVGVIALVSFLPGGWLSTPRDGWAAAAVLAAAATGYLLIEARNHGVAGWALLRALGVAAIGAVHALMISLIGLVIIAPAFIPDGSKLAGLWHRPGYGHGGMVLLLATAWCLAVGVFSQILWDDRPITSPLAHLSWRSR